MIKTIKTRLEKEGRLAEDASSDSNFSFLSSPTATLNTATESRRTELEDVRKSWKEVTGCEWEEDEARNLPPSTSQTANEAEAEIPTVSKTSAVVIHEAEAEASTKAKGKGVMTEEVEERLMKEQREREERKRRREEEEMAELRKIQERKAAMHFREQQIQLYAKQLDDLKARFPTASQLQEDEALALQLQEQFNKEEEEREKKKRDEAKFRITDSELAKEMREEWIAALISQGEDADYLEKLSNKEIYRAVMGQQGQLANKKRDEDEEEKAKQKSKKTIAFNIRTHEERKVMTDFLKARGESGKRLGPMSFMNLQALYSKVKKEEEEILGKTGSKKRVITQTAEHKSKKPKPSPSSTTSSSHHTSTLQPRPHSSLPIKSKSLHPTPPHQQPSKKKTKPTITPEDSREIVVWFYNTQDKWFEVFRGKEKLKRSIYKSVDEVLQLPDSDLRRILELGEAYKPENECGRHLLLAIKHHFNPSKDVIIDVKPLQSHSPFTSWSFKADTNEFILIDVKGQNMICSSKAIFKMPSKDIKTLSELTLNDPSQDPRGYEVERIVCNMEKLQQQKQ
ncbi:hypothetical protein L1987_23765 [Smallanthus sonchifolius]|uniref:Uncharacterized protein n=1 Tax=Smallanthus sonchifolius TaxID=185202 RepID=A0ACB9IKA6_9ASTR|nr:hypothetical protein L1987_23765 [Smallanthus sonchifolius]